MAMAQLIVPDWVGRHVDPYRQLFRIVRGEYRMAEL
jgi:hypothetical protein